MLTRVSCTPGARRRSPALRQDTAHAAVGGVAHFFVGAEIGLAKPSAAHRVAEAGVLLPIPGENIRLFGRQVEWAWRAGAGAERRSYAALPAC